ncbi:MAG TPA: hypothetical protein VED84_04380 [Acidimicrobiales bacterium]|nr:hypothetical protein [Acidimicrobiales bacterium]
MLVSGAGALVLFVVPGAAAPAAVATTSSVLTATKAAIAQQSSVHLVVTVKPSSTSSTERIVGDWGKKSGIESLSLGKATVTIKATPTYAFVSGNSSGLTSIFGLTAAQAKKLGKDWAFVKAGSSEYSGVKSSLTISSVADALPKAKGTKLSTEEAHGVKLYVLKWTVAATSTSPKLVHTLTVSAVGPTLPVEETMTAAGGGRETITFSKWGEHIVVKAPPADATIAYAKIVG